MIRYFIPILLFVCVGPLTAGTDGYLRQGPPRALRFAKLPASPPVVNELVLALNKPAKPDAAEGEQDDSPSTDDHGLPAYLESLIRDLIGKPAVARMGFTNDTAAPVQPSSTEDQVVDAVPVLPEAEALPPGNSPAEAAQNLSDILTIFNTGTNRRGKNGTAVVVAPPVFLPPQPASTGGSSRAVYRSP